MTADSGEATRCPECGEYLNEEGCQNDLCDDLSRAIGMDYHDAVELAEKIRAEGFYVRGIALAPNTMAGVTVSVAGGITLYSPQGWNDDARAKAKRRAVQRNRNAEFAPRPNTRGGR